MIVLIREEAERDLEEAFDFYEAQRSGLGQRFLDEYVRATREIAAHPSRWPIALNISNVHQFRIDPFPYGVVYKVEMDHCMIVAVAQLNRRPGFWQERLEP